MLEVALNAITACSGTRIDLGLNQATRELISSRHKKANAPVIVLLTDGHPTPGTEAAVLSAAKDARSLAFTVYTVGLGSDFDAARCARVAGASACAFAASDGTALRQIYTLIAGKARRRRRARRAGEGTVRTFRPPAVFSTRRAYTCRPPGRRAGRSMTCSTTIQA
ncbi:MAG: vWA domain-containing protein [Anaerolineae bacterium]